MAEELVLYTNPMSRGRIVRWMLEEVGAPYRAEMLEFGTTMKAPAYLADAFPQAGLAPPPAQRGAYYRWLFFAAGPLEASITNRSLKFEPPAERQMMVGYGTFAAVMDTLDKALSGRTYIAGDRFSAADVYVGSHINFGLQFGSIDRRPSFVEYSARVTDREAYRRAKALDDADLPKPPAQ